MQWVIDFISPPDDNPRAKSKWRRNISLTCGGLLLFVFMGTVEWSPFKVAYAKDIEDRVAKAVDAKIKVVEEQVKAVNEKVDKATAEQQEQRQLIMDSLAESAAGEIRLNISKRCRTTDSQERSELFRELETLRKKYRRFAGVDYKEPTCAEL